METVFIIIASIDFVTALKRFITACSFLLVAFSTHAAFTSLYAFGDGICTTTNGPGGVYYYGKRYTNGRVWLEVLAQRQEIPYEPDKNWSYFGHYSGLLLTNLAKFNPPADASTALFVIWVNDADFVWNTEHHGTELAKWTKAKNDSLTNHFKAITNLYSKGARTLIMPTAVDIGKTPYYSGLPSAHRTFIRDRIFEYNNGFAGTLNQALAACPQLAIYSPDFFSFVDNLLANPSKYGCIHPGIDALQDPALGNKSLNGPGANYVFWDYLDPTARVHAYLAEITQEMITPVRVSNLAVFAGSNRLDVANIPVGRNGFVTSTVDLLTWTTIQTFDSTNVTQQIFVPAAGSQQFYRLGFPFAWSWP